MEPREAASAMARLHARQISAPGPLPQVLVYGHFAYPIIQLVVFLVAFVAQSILTASPDESVTTNQSPTGPGGRALPKNTVPRSQREQKTVEISKVQKFFFNWLSVGLIATFLGNSAVILVHTLSQKPWWCGEAHAVYLIASVFVYALVLVSLVDTSPSPTIVHAITWSVGLLLELVLLAVSLAVYSAPHKDVTFVGNGNKTVRYLDGISVWEALEVTLDISRVLILVVLLGLYTALFLFKHEKHTSSNFGDASETTTLLNGHAENTDSSNAEYGAIPVEQKQTASQPAQAGWSRPTTAPAKSWWEYLRGYSLFFPYLWPAKSRRLQIVVIVCFLIVVTQRVVNLLVPIQVGVVTNKLSREYGNVGIPGWDISILVLLKLMQGSGGVLNAFRSTLWIPIGQYSYKSLSTAAFEHVHGLSLDFHLGKKTGEVISALSKGNSINTFLEQVTFQVLPMLFDLGIAIGYFLFAFDSYFALVVTIMAFLYLYLTIRMAQWRAEIRRQMVNASREEDAVKNDSMVSYETVKYFNAESYEFNRYRNAVETYQRHEYLVLFSLSIMNVVQNVVFTLGLLITSFIAAYQITTGSRKFGSFMTLLIYMGQLQAPLSFFGTFYRSIQSAMINSERLLELFKEQPTVVDDPDVRDLKSSVGEVRFDDVHFQYDPRKSALDGISFTAPAGSTTALVGESGGGKSTVFRLLFRFYNATSGRILIDGQNVRDVTIDSFRKIIGVVPQDTVLFNETLMYNLKYANPAVSDEEVFEACRAASIHDRILTFPDGYNTKVGERGLRLSGGEKQRVAIARTILKNPRIILLDEATAALDSETEQHIQEALTLLGKGRTMLVIAHRLSTITQADQILCLHDGKVAESGTHNELLRLKGRYASMWRKQIRAERAAEEARVLTDRAERLRKETADIPSEAVSENHSSEDESAPNQSRAPTETPAAARSAGLGTSDENGNLRP